MKQILCSILYLLASSALPGAPSNSPAALQADENGFTLDYDGARILSAASSGPVDVTNTAAEGERIEQRIRVAGQGSGRVSLKVTLTASSQAIAAETSGTTQQTFPMVRTSHGHSLNRRNNAVYDRFGDWMLEFPEDGTRITFARSNPSSNTVCFP